MKHALLSVKKACKKEAQPRPAEPAGRRLASAAGEAPPPGGTRKARSARRLQEFQEKKRAGFIAELVAKGCELAHAQDAVAFGERTLLVRKALHGATPMDADSAP